MPVSEQEFVDWLQRAFTFSHGTGIGDDTSVVKIPEGGRQETFQLVTKDILVENVHFSLDYFSLQQLALKSMAVNLSDIAAMGGVPDYFYLGLGFPRNLSRTQSLEFFKGLETGCKKWQVELAGGDYSSSPAMMISITMVGHTRQPVYRHTACAGDLICITGITGESAVGLRLLQRGERSGFFIDRHKDVKPHLIQGQTLSRYASAMIDLSDGLLLDLNRILTASVKGAKLWYEKVPVPEQLIQICKENNWDEYETVLAGGEDYILLFTISPEKEAQLKQENLSYFIIGKVTAEKGIRIEHNKQPIDIKYQGYDHFN